MKAIVLAVCLVVLHVAMRLLGFAAHTSVVAGMPQDPSSILIGPLYVVFYLAAVVLAPICALAGAFDLAFNAARGKARASRFDPK